MGNSLCAVCRSLNADMCGKCHRELCEALKDAIDFWRNLPDAPACSYPRADYWRRILLRNAPDAYGCPSDGCSRSYGHPGIHDEVNLNLKSGS